MKVKDLILELTKLDPEVEVRVAVYGCCGYDDAHKIDSVEFFEYDDYRSVNLDISVGCGVHRSAAFKTKCGAV